YHRDHGETANFLGLALRQQGHLEEALAPVEQAIAHLRKAFDQAPQESANRRLLGDSYANLIQLQRQRLRPEEAVAACLQRRPLCGRDGADLSRLACELALCVPLFGQGKTELTAAERAARQRCADLAMETLRQAVACGYQDEKELAQEKSLAPLR